MAVILRMTVEDAAEALRLEPEAVRRHIRRGNLAASTDSGKRGPSQRLYLDPAEVEAFAMGGAPAAKDYRDRKAGSTIKAKRPRRVKV